MTSDTPLQQLLRALGRFWWLALFGIALAGLAFVFATYEVKIGMPPKLTARTHSTYSASTQLLITSKRDPYLSSANVNNKVIKFPATTDTTPAGTTGAGATAGTQQTFGYDNSGADGDLQRVVEIANSLPPLVTSDPVIRLRNKRFRRIDGSVNAVNPYAFSGAGGFRSGPLPFIKISGTANSPQDARDITNQTALAFKQWFEARQVTSHIPPGDRVLVEQVNSAEKAFANSGAKPLLGVAAALLVLLGGAGFVLALDRLIPRRKPRVQRAPVAVREEIATVPAPAPAMPALEVPTMTFGTKVEPAAAGAKPKTTPRPRKAATNGSGGGNGNGNGHSNGTAAATRRKRTTTSAPRVAPKTDDAD